MTMDGRAKSEPILAAANTAAAGGAGAAGGQPQHQCAGCGKGIGDRFLLRALDQFWHEDCLKCGCCDCRLGEVGSTLYTKSNLMLCKRDYLRLFGNTGLCAACNKMIPAFEMVMRARTNVYHLECFACQQCNHRFCVGDRFYLCENKILCEYDYEERLVFASIGNHPMLKRHANSMAGSPTSTPSGQTLQPQQQHHQQQQQLQHQHHQPHHAQHHQHHHQQHHQSHSQPPFNNGKQHMASAAAGAASPHVTTMLGGMGSPKLLHDDMNNNNNSNKTSNQQTTVAGPLNSGGSMF